MSDDASLKADAAWEDRARDIRRSNRRAMDRARQGPPGEAPVITCETCGYVECRCCSGCLEYHPGERCDLDPLNT